ncbi:MAG TPA: hypothetical protein VF529_22685 [Solirubrobacteraceae bacterium]
MTPLRPLVLLLVAVLALGVAACGNEAQEDETFQSENAQVAETEGVYLELGEVKYQVQVSRQLNPLLVADKDYFEGISESDLDLADDEVWFGVWMRVENESEEPQPTASRFTIHDTQENEYVPVRIGEPNPFAYRAGRVEGEELYPLPDSPAGERAPNGALILFKLKRFSLDNRPLELELEDPARGRPAIVNLDV